MAKFTLTIECATQEELIELVQRMNGPLIVTEVSPEAVKEAVRSTVFPETDAPFPIKPGELQELETQAAAPALETPPPSEKRRGRPPKKTDLKPGEPKLNGNGEQHLPELDALKNAVVAAVKAARTGGNGAVLDLLPEFKEKTGLQFVMDAKDEHRQALFDLIQKAGLELA